MKTNYVYKGQCDLRNKLLMISSSIMMIFNDLRNKLLSENSKSYSNAHL